MRQDSLTRYMYCSTTLPSIGYFTPRHYFYHSKNCNTILSPLQFYLPKQSHEKHDKVRGGCASVEYDMLVFNLHIRLNINNPDDAFCHLLFVGLFLLFVFLGSMMSDTTTGDLMMEI